jgi:hypothetical protein
MAQHDITSVMQDVAAVRQDVAALQQNVVALQHDVNAIAPGITLARVVTVMQQAWERVSRPFWSISFVNYIFKG